MLEKVKAELPVSVRDLLKSSGSADLRSLELASFLRGRREALSPEDVGLPPTRRRRTPGLRREEVAELADISTSLYTWLEQGRDVAVSKRTIESVANALQLSVADRRHLYVLANPDDIALDEVVSPALTRLIDSMVSHPAFVLDHVWNIVARNGVACAVYQPATERLAQPDETSPNFLEHVFLDPEFRENCIDWAAVVADIVALFRYQFAAYAADARSVALVERLQGASPVFAAHWEQHLISPHPVGVRAYRHPIAGVLRFEPSVFSVVESAGLRLLVYRPVDEETTARVAGLMRSIDASSAPCGA